MSEKRYFHRVGHDARATLSLDERTWQCTVEDLSLKGCLVELAENWALDPDGLYKLSIHLTYSIHIEMDVKLSHQQGLHAGFRCIGIDADSIAKLRRLVELNLGDSALLERDLRMLASGMYASN